MNKIKLRKRKRTAVKITWKHVMLFRRIVCDALILGDGVLSLMKKLYQRTGLIAKELKTVMFLSRTQIELFCKLCGSKV